MSDHGTDEARERLARAQLALLSTLVADAPPPEGFDPGRLEVQRLALLRKRTGVVAKVAPALPEILGHDFRRLFLAYARGRPMSEGYQRDALDFARHVLHTGAVPESRRPPLTAWVAERTASPAPAAGPVSRLAAALRIRLGTGRMSRWTKGN